MPSVVDCGYLRENSRRTSCFRMRKRLEFRTTKLPPQYRNSTAAVQYNTANCKWNWYCWIATAAKTTEYTMSSLHIALERLNITGAMHQRSYTYYNIATVSNKWDTHERHIAYTINIFQYYIRAKLQHGPELLSQRTFYREKFKFEWLYFFDEYLGVCCWYWMKKISTVDIWKQKF